MSEYLPNNSRGEVMKPAENTIDASTNVESRNISEITPTMTLNFKKKRYDVQAGHHPSTSNSRSTSMANKWSRQKSFQGSRSHCENTGNAPSARCRQFQRLCQQSNSLTIISLWAFFVNFPFVVYTFYLGAVAEDRLMAVYSPVGVIATSATVLTAIGLPFLYAWRFVAWREMFDRIRSSTQS